jgi:hypothetical protein
MSATTNNQNPIFIKDPLYAAPAGSTDFIGSGSGVVLTANTALDGTGSVGSTLILLATIPSSGAVLNKIILSHLGTNIATVVRVFINNGSSVATATNNRLFREYTMSANTLSQTSASVQVIDDFYGLGYRLPAGSVLYITTGTTIAGGIQVQGFFDGLAS